MKTFKALSLFSAVIFIAVFVLHPSVFADKQKKQIQKKQNSSMVSSGGQMRQAGGTHSNNTQLNPNQGARVGGGRGNTPKDIPGRGNHFMGSQGGINTIQTGTSQTGASGTQSGGQTPKGPSWLTHGKSEGDKKTKSVSELSRENQLKNLTDPTAGLNDKNGNPIDLGNNKLSDRPRGKGALTGQGNDFEVGHATVHQGDGKNQSSRRDQQSEGAGENDNDDIYDKAGNYMGKRGELKKDEDQQMWGNMDASERDSYARDNEEFRNAGIKNESEAKQVQEQQDTEMRGGIKSKEEAEAMQKQQEAEMKLQEQTKDSGDFPTPSGGDTVAMPNPDAVDSSHLPWYLRGQKKTKSPEEVAREKKRQVTLPGETNRELSPNDVRVTHQDITNRLTAGKINPVPDGASTPTGGRDPNSPFKGTQPRPGGPDEGHAGDQGTSNGDKN